ncbi:MAG: tetratricopeptide repeat protein [Methanoregula sp.]
MAEIKLFSLLACLFIIGMAVTPGCFDISGPVPDNSVGSYLRQAHGAEGIGSYSSATSYYTKALEIEPSNASALLGKSHALIVRKQYTEALDTSKKAQAAAPSSALPYIYEGVALDGLGRYQEAVKAFTTALAIDPKLVYAKSLITAAIARDELTRNPENAMAWYMAGSAYYILDQNGSYLQRNANTLYQDIAEQALKNATRLNPENSVAWEELGTIYLKSFDYTDAAVSYRKSLALNPDNGEAWYGLAQTYRLNNQYQDEITTIESGIAAVPDNPKLWLFRAHTYSSLYFSRQNNQTVNAGTYSALNFEDEAIRSYEQATLLDPANEGAWEDKARFLSSTGRYEAAIAAWQGQLAHTRETSLGKANIYADIGDAYYKLQKYPEAKSAYEEAVRLYPNHERAKDGRDKSANPLMRVI